ncbi:HNH endonuclease signature motif containing protein [Microbacterium sp. K24]|uniref:HNH endonuclease signature motif containing protein n=1 Tax=Microbacterium sp. K24 TaxID=2305446 RepID=UPI00109D0FDF|nr:HNH endonuclease signature motif containing protein [Microbacterium sp. K24]
MTSPTDNSIEHRQALLDAWVEKRRQISVLEAESSGLLADRMRVLDDDVREHPHHREAIHRSMIAEYAAAGRIAKGSAEYAFSDACLLDSDHPAVRESFRRGGISAGHVREIVRAGMIVRLAVRKGRVDAETLSLYDAAALEVAEHDSPGRTRAMVRQIAASLAGETLVERHRRARSERAVTMRSVDDGLALLQVLLPEHLAAAILDRLTRLGQQVIATRDDQHPVLSPDALDLGVDAVFVHDLAPDDPLRDDPALNDHHIDRDPLGGHVVFGDDTFTTDPCIEHVPADERTLDEVRADLLTDLLLAGDPSATRGTGLDSIQARVQVTVAASTLAGDDERPAELDGFGPLHPDVARDLAARAAIWARLLLGHDGTVTSTNAYSPTEAMRRHLRARDQHCRFPGCRMPVHRCQIDHNHDHARGGPTSNDNLAHLCVGHHALKHPEIDDRYRWTARQLPGGDIEWTSPLGRVYNDAVPRRVMFV